MPYFTGKLCQLPLFLELCASLVLFLAMSTLVSQACRQPCRPFLTLGQNASCMSRRLARASALGPREKTPQTPGNSGKHVLSASCTGSSLPGLFYSEGSRTAVTCGPSLSMTLSLRKLDMYTFWWRTSITLSWYNSYYRSHKYCGPVWTAAALPYIAEALQAKLHNYARLIFNMFSANKRA